MVYQPTQPSEVNGSKVKKHKRSRIAQIALDAATLVLVAGATYAIFRLTAVKPENQEVNNPEVVSKAPVDEEEEERTDWLTRAVTQWIALYPRNFRASVAVYDFDNEVMIAEAEPDEVFAEQGASDLGAKFGLNFATENQTSAREMMGILQATYRHAGMSELDYAALKTELLAQPDILSQDRCQGYCRTRYGLPAGFEVAKVYNENYMDSNGSFFLAYRDAAILEFQTSDGRTRNFAAVVLGEYFADQAEFAKLGKIIEENIVAHFDSEPLN